MNEPQPKVTNLESRNIDQMANAFKPQQGGELAIIPESAVAKSGPFEDKIITAQAVGVKRDIAAFLQRMKILAQMAGTDYRYEFPVKSKNGRTSKVEGGTIKLANDLAREYGNCTVDVRVVDGGQEWIFYARFIDLESGFTMTRPFSQRKEQTTMGDDKARARDIAFQIGTSKAIRNVVLNSLQTYYEVIFEEAKNSMYERIGKDLEDWKQLIQKRCKELGYDLKRIERQITKPIEEWLTVDMVRVVAELKSISDGMALFNELYPMEHEEEIPVKETTIDDIKAKHSKKEKKNESAGGQEPPKKDESAVCADCGGTGVCEFVDQEDGQIVRQDCACKKQAQGKLV